ncbi:MAG: PD40 domain-containing protein [Thermoleophilia bacterium]|nr:PD40 domain-containing protein [Thermoleophilia bacterium]
METTAGALIAAVVLSLSGAAERPLVLVVESAGNVVAVHADGKRVRLAAGREPALSPDGNWLAFVRDGDVWVVRLPDGSPRRVAAGSAPAWAPDGRLAYAAADGVRIGGRLVAPAASEPAWSRDGRLAVVTEAGIVVGGQVAVPGGRSPAFARDGRLAYVLGDGVHVDGLRVSPGGRDPAWDPSGRLTVATAVGVLVDGAPIRGTRAGDRAPAWGRPPEPHANDLLPDLDQRAPTGVTIARSGGRYRLGFTSATDNVGPGVLWVRGRRPSMRSYEMRADQLVEQRGGGVRVVRGVGRIRFVSDAPHHHWHFMRFQQFELRRRSDFQLLARDRKTGFCFADHYGLARHRVSAFRGPRFLGDCGQWLTGLRSVEMGTSPGYTDRYPAHFHGQNVDLTGIPPGVYVLVHRANPQGAIREIRYDNNAASVRLRLSWRRGVPSVRLLRVCERSERC